MNFKKNFHALCSSYISRESSLPPVFINITLDYETWQPIPTGYTIDWDKDIFEPTNQWVEYAERYNFCLTFFIEMCELLWLRKNLPIVAKKMETQIKNLVKNGHDIQLHLHPAWLPELGTKYVEGTWYGLNTNHRLHDVPIDIEKVIAQAKNDLEKITHSVNKDYKITTFRARKYQIQPSEIIVKALLKNGLKADSSVWKGGFSTEHLYDFREAYHEHQPYFINPKNVNAQTFDKNFLEIPIFSTNGNRWILDNYNAQEMLKPLIDSLMKYGYNTPSPIREKIKCIVNKSKLPTLPSKNGIIFTAIAHTKIPKSDETLSSFFSELSSLPQVYSTSCTEIVNRFFFSSEWNTNFESEWKNTFYLTKMIPPDKKRIWYTGNDIYWKNNINKKLNQQTKFDCIVGSNNQKTLQKNQEQLTKKGIILIATNKPKHTKEFLIEKKLHIQLERTIDQKNTILMSSKNNLNYSWKKQRIRELTQWCYNNITPSEENNGITAQAILKRKKALCAGYVTVLSTLISNEKLAEVKLWTLAAENMPHGRGTKKIDTHEVLEVKIGNTWHLVDPTLNLLYLWSLKEIIEKPELAEKYGKKRIFTQRYQNRSYSAYTTDLYRNLIYAKESLFYNNI